jgi:chromosome segregation ATPase
MSSSIKDNIASVNKSIEDLKKQLNIWNTASFAEKKNISNKIENIKKTLDFYMKSISSEIDTLNDDKLEMRYRDEYTKLKDEVKKIKDEYQQKKSELSAMDHKDITIEMRNKDINEMNVQEAFDRGDKVLKDSDQIINNVGNMVNEANENAVKIQQELHRQNEQLGNIQGELNEIDESLKRSNKTMRQILVGLATDKFILCMIVIIVLIIITIIIVGAVGGDPDKKFNVPHDLFSTKKAEVKNTTIVTGLL